MGKSLVATESIRELALQQASTVREYELGTEFRVKEDDETVSTAMKEFIYVKAGGALVKGGVYRLDYSSAANSQCTTSTPATTDINSRYGVALYTVASGSYAFLQTKGDISLVNTAGTVISGDVLKVNYGAATVADESTAVRTQSSIAIATAAVTGAGTISAYLFGNVVLNAGGGAFPVTTDWSFVQVGTALVLYYQGIATSNAFTSVEQGA